MSPFVRSTLSSLSALCCSNRSLFQCCSFISPRALMRWLRLIGCGYQSRWKNAPRSAFLTPNSRGVPFNELDHFPQGLLQTAIFRLQRLVHIHRLLRTYPNELHDHGGKSALLIIMLNLSPSADSVNMPFERRALHAWTIFQASWLYQSSQLMTSLKRAQLRQRAKNRQLVDGEASNGRVNRPKQE